MLHIALKMLGAELATYLGLPSNEVVVNNVSKIHEDATLAGKVLVSMINISEENTLKNLPHYRNESGLTHYERPPVHLNLTIMVSANYTNYETSLQRISGVVMFFQGKPCFTHQNTPAFADDLGDFKILVDLFSHGIDQANQMWSMLGGKQIPYVCYKIRDIELKRPSLEETRPWISEISIQSQTEV